MQGVATRRKREKLLQFMDRWKDDEAVQRVGKKLIDRIDQSLEEEMADLEKEKEKKMELHKLKILAENDNEVAQL